MIDLIITELSELLLEKMPTLTIRTGAKYLDENVSAPRLVWVYNDETTGPPKKMTDSSGMPLSACFTRNASVSAHIWGISRAGTEAVLHNTMTAIHRLLHGSCKVGGPKWPKGSQHLEQGMFCVLPLAVYIPVMTGFVTLPTAPPSVPEYPGGIPAGAPSIEGMIIDPTTGLEVAPPSPGDSPSSSQVALNPTDYISANGDAAETVEVVESGAGAGEIVIENVNDYSDPS